MEQARPHRIEEGLGQFRLLVVDQQADVEELDLEQRLVVEQVGAQVLSQGAGRLVGAVVVGRKALAHGVLHAFPVAGFEQGLGATAVGTQFGVVGVEGLDGGFGDASGDGVEFVGNAHFWVIWRSAVAAV